MQQEQRSWSSRPPAWIRRCGFLVWVIRCTAVVRPRKCWSRCAAVDGHPRLSRRDGAWLPGGVGARTASMPIWQDELYLELLHRGCATSRPDQKRHNRILERLLREADLVEAARLARPCRDWPTLAVPAIPRHPSRDVDSGGLRSGGVSIWRTARRKARARRVCAASSAGHRPRQPTLVLSPGPGVVCNRCSVGLRFEVAAAAGGLALPADAICRCSRLRWNVWVQLPRQYGAVAVALTSAAQPA